MGTPIDIWLVGNTGLRNPKSRMDSLYLQNPLSLEISEVGKTILRL